jgi:hypothetical protein
MLPRRLITSKSQRPEVVSKPRAISSAAFLKLEEIEKPLPLRSQGGCWFNIGLRQLHSGVEEHFRPPTKAHPAFAVKNIEKVFIILNGACVRCSWDEALDGVRCFYANVPCGNRLEFTEPTS